MSRLLTEKATLSHEDYENFLSNRGVTKIEFNKFIPLLRLTQQQKRDIIEIKHIWKLGDRYSKLASIHYGNASYWWIIAYYNQKPIENMVSLGDIIIIPKPLDRLITLLSGR